MTEKISNLILATAEDAVTRFLYYGRKEDEELPVGAIEAAVAAGDITADAIVEQFSSHLRENLPEVVPLPVGFGDFRLGTRSLDRLAGVHPDIFAVTQYAVRLSPIDFGIPRTGGLRDATTQTRLTAAGKSRAKFPRHVTGHAVDIYAIDPETGKATWEPRHVLEVHGAFQVASMKLDVPLRWGGDWDGDGNIRERGENDLVHHELPRRVYGDNKRSQSAKAAAFLVSIGRAA